MTARIPVKIRQLQYFLAAARTLHFSRAAEELFVTQPTLSHQIAELEAQLGTPLFDRTAKSVRLTQAGEVLLAYAKRGLGEMEAGIGALEELEGLQRGLLRIGVTQSFLRKLMPPILGQFMQRYPSVRLSVDEMTAGEIEKRLADGELDLGIAFAPALLEDTEIETILQERLLLVTGRTHRFAARRRVRMRELAGEPLALFGKEYSTRHLLERYFKEAGIEPDVVCSANAIDVMLGIAKESAVATIIPESAIEKTPDIRVIELIDPVPVRISAVLWARHRFRSAAARTFAQLVRDRFLSKLVLR